MNVSDAPLTGCFHCGLPVPAGSRWQVTVAGSVQRMCCPGCAAATEAIVGAGMDDYYSTRTDYAAPIEPVDEAELLLADGLNLGPELVLSVEGIRCAACAWLIERHLARVPGVLEVSLNLATGRLFVKRDQQLCQVSTILAALRAIGYSAYPYDPGKHGAQLERARKRLFRQLFVAGLSMMQVMMYAVPVYVAEEGTMDADMAALMGWASLLLTLPALLYSALPFFQGALQDLRRGMPGMDVPVTLGIVAAFVGSCINLVAGTGELYFDSVTMFVFLLLCSRYLELGARRRAATALDRLQQALPASALRLLGDPARRDTELVAASRLQPGDLVLVKPGQVTPADGQIEEGETEVDLSLLTGESRPAARTVGDALPGGALNVAQAVVVRVTSSATHSTLALLVRLAERAGQGKPSLALWADRVARWFVLGLLALTVLVFFGWQLVDSTRAWPIAIAVLVVSCPCALSLATPTALAAATDRLLARGVLALQAHTLETFERATHVVFDKTGTLTTGRPALVRTETLGRLDGQACLRIASALEQDNAHPLAQALRGAGPAPDVAGNCVLKVGQGVEGWIDGSCYRIGNAGFVSELSGAALAAPASAGATVVWLGDQSGALARFELVDAIRPEAASVVARLQASGKEVVLLSGDASAAVEAVARELGIATALGGQLPEQKLAYVRALQQGGSVVAMVGDGINDAAVLGGADVSFAMGSGAELAQLHADGVLLADGLTPLADTAAMARRTLGVIRQNLAWAMLYNVVAIPAAALGLVNAWLCSIGMALSSALVVLNALRLRKDL